MNKNCQIFLTFQLLWPTCQKLKTIITLSIKFIKNFNKKDTYLISTTSLYIYFFRPQEQKSFYKTESNFSDCRYILLTTIENLIYLSTIDSGTVSFYTPSHKKTPQLPTALARKKYKTKVMFDYTKKQRCFCCCYLCSGWHSLFDIYCGVSSFSIQKSIRMLKLHYNFIPT